MSREISKIDMNYVGLTILSQLTFYTGRIFFHENVNLCKFTSTAICKSFAYEMYMVF